MVGAHFTLPCIYLAQEKIVDRLNIPSLLITYYAPNSRTIFYIHAVLNTVNSDMSWRSSWFNKNITRGVEEEDAHSSLHDEVGYLPKCQRLIEKCEFIWSYLKAA